MWCDAAILTDFCKVHADCKYRIVEHVRKKQNKKTNKHAGKSRYCVHRTEAGG